MEIHTSNIETLQKLLPLLIALNSYKVYVFGSILNGERDWSDIDIVVVYDVGQDVSPIRAIVAPYELLFPLDVLIMSSTEEVEFNFIQVQNAKRLNDLISQ